MESSSSSRRSRSVTDSTMVCSAMPASSSLSVRGSYEKMSDWTVSAFRHCPMRKMLYRSRSWGSAGSASGRPVISRSISSLWIASRTTSKAFPYGSFPVSFRRNPGCSGMSNRGICSVGAPRKAFRALSLLTFLFLILLSEMPRVSRGDTLRSRARQRLGHCRQLSSTALSRANPLLSHGAAVAVRRTAVA